jgi:hypothetical protein
MNTNKSRGLALVPKQYPGEGPLGAFLEDPVLPDTLGKLEESQSRAVLWTIALQNAFSEQKLASRIPGFRFASVGFADPETEADAFGLMVYTAPLKAKEDVFGIEVAGITFPIRVRPSIEELHLSPELHPSDGTSTCWAISRKPNVAKSLGFLTAKHVVENLRPGDAVNTNMGVGSVLDLAPASIDAALIAPPRGVSPQMKSPLECVRYVAQWTDVQFVGMGSRQAVQTKVTEVWFRDVYHPSLPATVFLAWPGKPGDSGALVVDANGKGIAMYLGGQINTATSRMEGFGQHLDQAAHLLDCSLYR